MCISQFFRVQVTVFVIVFCASMGIRQKLGLDKKAGQKDQQQEASKKLTSDLVGLYKKGKLKAGEVGKLAQRSAEYGAGQPGSSSSSSCASDPIQKLAKAAPKGLKANPHRPDGKLLPDTTNSARSLKRTFAKDCPLPPLYSAMIPALDANQSKQF